jgi:hypothetical protein
MDASGYGPAARKTKSRSVRRNSAFTSTYGLGYGRKKTGHAFFARRVFLRGRRATANLTARSLRGKALLRYGQLPAGCAGIHGFFFSGRALRPNCGLSDVVRAIDYVKENISVFCGDPENITYSGSRPSDNMLRAACDARGKGKNIKVIMMSGSPTLMHTKEQGRGLRKNTLIMPE